MKIQQIRSAMIRIDYAGKTFLTDPWLAEKGAMGPFNDPSFRYCRPEQAEIAMPMCDLPMPRETILEGVDAYVVTHVHPDHIDMAADGTVGEFMDKNVPVFVQSEDDANVLKRSGFSQVRVLSQDSSFEGIRLIKTPGLHGTKIPCGPSCGVIFDHPSEKKLYVAGDTIWYESVAETIKAFRPDVVILNACAAEFIDQGRLIMDDEDVKNVCDACPDAKIIISHMDNVAHAAITRKNMRERLTRRGIWEKVLMPDDGEAYSF